jgi:hypothetical protein
MMVPGKQWIKDKLCYSSICKSKKKLIPFHQILNTTKLRTFYTYRLVHWRRKQRYIQPILLPVFNALGRLYSPVYFPRGSRAMGMTSKGFITVLSEKTLRQKMDENQLLSLFQKSLCISEAKAKETVANKKVSSLLVDIIQFVS